MNPEVKKQWVEALRSGEYKQGKGFLKIGGTYCCLGVLCELYPQVEKIRTELKDGSDREVCSYGGTVSFPPHEVREWAGLTYEDPIVEVAGERSTLSELNDEHKLSFAEIADLIDEQL